MNFQYAPGLFGYGANGADGSSGLQGMSIYFTDYDVVFNKINIENAIKNNYVLWSVAPPMTKLNREYLSGDLFVNELGYIYEIDAVNGTFSLTPGRLYKEDFFETLGQTTHDNFERWFNFNIVDASSYFLFDNINANSVDINKSVYGIDLKNFTRIEYTDVSNNNQGLTVYSSGENRYIDDHKSISIIFDRDGNTFRIGNKELLGNILPVNLVIDASLVSHNTQKPFTKDTQINSVLRKKEFNTIGLFGERFNPQPSSFTSSNPYTKCIRITWNLSDFSPDDIKADLYFYINAYPSTSKTYNLMSVNDATPLIFHDIDESGFIDINELTTGQSYSYHINFYQNGWERSSNRYSRIAT